ncbi:Peptidyl-prolyl cis-trans isomerase FKBP17-2, chloroplastic [Linum grandiflorum]
MTMMMKLSSSMITGGGPQPLPRTSSTTRSFRSISCSLQTQQLTTTDSFTSTRRFGLGAAGISWAAFLASRIVSNKKTKDMEKEGVVTLPNGIRYYDMEIGAGECPREGDLVVMNLKGNVVGGSDGEEIVDTKAMAMVVTGSRPYSKGMCEGVEHVVRSMKAGGVRKVIVPPSFGFGVHGADFGPLSRKISPSSTLEYIVEVCSVSSIPPA